MGLERRGEARVYAPVPQPLCCTTITALTLISGVPQFGRDSPQLWCPEGQGVELGEIWQERGGSQLLREVGPHGISEGPSGCEQKTQRMEEGGDEGCDLGPGVAWTRAVAGEREEEGMGRVKSQQIKKHGPYDGPPGMSCAFSWPPFSIIALLQLTPCILPVEDKSRPSGGISQGVLFSL